MDRKSGKSRSQGQAEPEQRLPQPPDEGPSDTEPFSSRSAKARRPQVASACENCRSAKVKCTGSRPTCSRCYERGIACTYNIAEEGVTRGQHVRRRLIDLSRRLDQTTAVLHVLQHATDEDASEVLARLRMGESVEQLAGSMQALDPSPLISPVDMIYGVSDPATYSDAGLYLYDPSFALSAAEQTSHNRTNGGGSEPSTSITHDFRDGKSQEFEEQDGRP